MGKFTTHSEQGTTHPAPQLTTRLKKIMFACSFLWMLFSNSLLAQTGISLTWDQAVGCQITSPNGDDPKRSDELIQTATCLRVCEFSTVNYTLIGDDNSAWASTNWNVIGGVIQAQNTSTCTVAWGSAGVGSISASINIGNIIETIPALCVEIINSPYANFSVNQVSGSNIDVCRNQIIYFTNNSTPNGGSELVSYLWDFGDGSFSSEFQPTHTFTDSASFTVKLTVKNACKCSNIWETDFNVGSEGVPIDCLSVVCENDRAMYNVPSQLHCQDYPSGSGPGDTDTTPAEPAPTEPIPSSGTIGLSAGNGNTTQVVGNRHWSVIGGVITSTLPYYNQIEVLWNHIDESGFGYVSFESTGCDVECQSKTTIKVPVVQQNGTIFGELNPCPNKQYRYKLPQWPTTDFNWSIETDTGATLIPTDQRNEVIIQTMGAGEIALSAIYHNTLLNCGGASRDFVILVKDAPVIDGPTKVCLGATIYTLPEGFTGAWEIKNTKGILFQSANGNSFTANFNNPGNYILTVTGDAFCAIPSIKIRVLPKPAIPIATNVLGPRIVCPGTPVTYKYNNENPNSVIGWGANGGVFAGSNYGETVTAQFLTSYPSNLDYVIKVWRENKEAPHCVSDILQIVIKRPDLNVDIKAADSVNGANPCPSSYQTYTIKNNVTLLPYTDGEVYEWTLINPTTNQPDAAWGSVSDGNGTSEISILWNEFVVNTTVTLRLRLRKCNQYHIYDFPITILAHPTFTINAPNLVCENETFLPTISIANATVHWYNYDGSLKKDDYDSYYFELTGTELTNPNNSFHELRAFITEYNGCKAFGEAIKVIEVKPQPRFKVLPEKDTYVCGNPPYQMAITDLISNGSVNIKWYEASDYYAVGTEITGATATTYNVLHSGYYYASVANLNGCSIRSRTIEIYFSTCGPGGPSTPGCVFIHEPVVTLSKVLPDVCNSIKSIAVFDANSQPTWYNWWVKDLDYHDFDVMNNTQTQSDIIFKVPGTHTITYNASFPAVGGTLCYKRFEYSIFIPYVAKIGSTIDCGSSGNYDVTVNNGTLYAVTESTEQYYIDNVLQTTQYNHSSTNIFNTFNLAPGQHVIKLVVSTPGYAPCVTEITVDLLPKPDASFDFTSLACASNCTQICSDKKLEFTVTNPVPNQEYLWNFGDNSSNAVQDPEKVYQLLSTNLNTYQIVLTVKNKYCTTTSNPRNITVYKNRIDQQITIFPSDGIVCEGIAVLYNHSIASANSSPAAHYTWMQGIYPISGVASAATFNANQSGNYWTMLEDQYGCTSPTFYKSSTIIMVPDTTISGPSAVCTDTPFTLSGFAGGANTQYQWKMGGVIESNFALNNSELFQDIQGGLGDYDYILNIKVPKTGSSTEFCYSPDITKLVTIYSPPNPPTVNIVTDAETNSCTPYALTLHATSDQIGTFNWSNGASTENSNESTIVVNEGGPFEVKFTNLAGCDASSQIVVPKDPDTYMWVFPNGCYEFCNKPLNTSHFLLGPLPEFATWEWQFNDTSLSGTGVVPNYELNTDTGTYHLVLGNPFCTRTSKPMDVTVNICEACEFRATIKEIFAVQREFCSYDIVCTISNPYTYPIAVSIAPQENIGYFQPLTITVLPGTDHYTLNMVPLNNFNGGVQNIIFQSVTADGIMCASEIEGQFPRLCIVRRVANEVGNANGISMVIAPNPSHGATQLFYDFNAPITTDTTLVIYDLLGRLLATHQPNTSKGIWELDMSAYAKGQYIAVMKQNGKAVEQKNIIVQ